MKRDGYICTDPDNLQFGKQISENIFSFQEYDRGNNALPQTTEDTLLSVSDEIWEDDFLWVEGVINLDHYHENEIARYISAYYKNLDELKGYYPKDWKFIVAECIFEQESGLY